MGERRASTALTVEVLGTSGLHPGMLLAASGGEGGLAGCSLRVDFGQQRGSPPAAELSLADLAAGGGAGAAPLLTSTFDVEATAEGIGAVANSPVTVCLLECQRVERKKKVEVTLVEAATATIPLLPLILGARDSIEASVPLAVSPGYALVPSTTARDAVADASGDGDSDPAVSRAPVPSLRVAIRVDQSVVGEADTAGRLLSFALPRVFSLPDTWASGSGGQQSYVLSIPLPQQGGGPDRRLTIPGGAVSIPDAPSSENEPDERLGDFQDAAGRAHRQAAEHGRACVAWPATHAHVFLQEGALSTLKQRLAGSRVLPVHVEQRTAASSKSKSRAGKQQGEEEETTTFHGVAYVAASSLLYPGRAELSSAVALAAYSEPDYKSRTRLDVSSQLDAASAAKSKKKDGKRDKEGGGPDAAAAAAEAAARAVAEAQTYLLFGVAVSAPLVAQRSRADAVEQVKELIPERPPFPSATQSAKRAVSDYHLQIKAIAQSLLEDYSTVCGSGEGGVDQCRRKLVGELNQSGKYFAIKEQLKRAVIKLVREKFLHTEKVSDPAERHQFLSDLFVFLNDEMHRSINATFAFGRGEEAAPVAVGIEQLRYFAAEAEARGDLDVATRYFQDCLSKSSADASIWFDYGCFCLRVGDLSRADECFREAVSISATHVPALLLCGVVACKNEDSEEAATYLESATTFEPKNAVAWNIRGFVSEQLGDPITAEMCFAAVQQLGAQSEDAVSQNLRTAQFCIPLSLPELVEAALAREVVAGGDTASATFMACQARLLLLQGNSDEAYQVVRGALETDFENAELWALQGDVLHDTQRFGEALKAYEHAIDLTGEFAERPATMVRLASLYLADEDFERAKHAFVQCCSAMPSAVSWKGVGVACYRLGELGEAEEALAESNIYDNRDAEVWTYLSLICVRTRRVVEAEQTFKYAAKLGVAGSAALLDELRMEQAEAGFGSPFVVC